MLMTKKPTDGPTKAELAEAEALEARGWPYHYGEERVLDRLRPGWRARLREAKERGEGPKGPSLDADRAAVEHRVQAELGGRLAKAEEALAAAVAARGAVVEKIFATPEARATEREMGGRPDAPSHFFCRDADLNRALVRASREEAVAREDVTTINSEMVVRRYALAAER